MPATDSQPGEAFLRGPYGEILPPPLLTGITPDRAIEDLLASAQAAGTEVRQVPKRGRSRDGLAMVALAHHHQASV